jgi:hypothetical protein
LGHDILEAGFGAGIRCHPKSDEEAVVGPSSSPASSAWCSAADSGDVTVHTLSERP